jgi:hypothetical protein
MLVKQKDSFQFSVYEHGGHLAIFPATAIFPSRTILGWIELHRPCKAFKGIILGVNSYNFIRDGINQLSIEMVQKLFSLRHEIIS